MDESGLTVKQRRFCEEYLIDRNATDAYFRAGYSVQSRKAAATNAFKLLRTTNISSYLNYLESSRADRCQVTADRVMQEIAAIAFSNWADVSNDDGTLKPRSEISEFAIKSIAEVEVIDRSTDGIVNRKARAKLHNKLKALQMLAQMTGLLTDINLAIKCLKSYGIHLRQAEDGQWVIVEN